MGQKKTSDFDKTERFFHVKRKFLLQIFIFFKNIGTNNEFDILVLWLCQVWTHETKFDF